MLMVILILVNKDYHKPALLFNTLQKRHI